MRTLLLIAFLVCLAATFLTALPVPGMFSLFGLALAIPAILVVLMIYGTRYQRAFAIGAISPAVFALLFAMVYFAVLPKCCDSGYEARRVFVPPSTLLARYSIFLTSSCRAFLAPRAASGA
jgi:hypothetical protein